MDMRKYAGSSFIQVDDVRDRPIQVTIIKVVEGNYGKPDLILSDGRRFSLNATNTKTLIAAYGVNDADWLGMHVEFCLGQIKYQGKFQDSVMVKPVSPGKPVAERKPPPPPEMNDDIPF